MRISLEWPLAAAFALGFALAGVSPAGRGTTSRHYTSGYAGAVPFIGRTLDPANGHLSSIGLVPLKNSLAFTV